MCFVSSCQSVFISEMAKHCWSSGTSSDFTGSISCEFRYRKVQPVVDVLWISGGYLYNMLYNKSTQQFEEIQFEL